MALIGRRSRSGIRETFVTPCPSRGYAGVGGGPRKCFIINDLQMLAPPNTFTIRANVAQPRKLNADSFRARCLAMGYIVAYEKPKDQTPDQSPDRNLHWRSQSLHWQIR